MHPLNPHLAITPKEKDEEWGMSAMQQWIIYAL